MGSRPAAAACSARYLGTHRAHARGPRQRPTRPGGRSSGRRAPARGPRGAQAHGGCGNGQAKKAARPEARGSCVAQECNLRPWVNSCPLRFHVCSCSVQFLCSFFRLLLYPWLHSIFLSSFTLFFFNKIYLISISTRYLYLFQHVFSIPHNSPIILFLTIQYNLSICFFVMVMRPPFSPVLL